MKAREIAFKILCDIEENNNYSNIAINKPRKKAITQDPASKTKTEPQASEGEKMRERDLKPTNTNTNIVIGQTTYIHLNINLIHFLLVWR